MSHRRRLSISAGIAVSLAALLVLSFLGLQGMGGTVPVPPSESVPLAEAVEALPEPSAAPSPAAAVRPTTPALPTAKPFLLRPEPLTGPTRFVRRLEAGSRFRKLRADLHRPNTRVQWSEFATLGTSAMLRADCVAFSRRTQQGPNRLRPEEAVLEVFTAPPCDLETLRLAPLQARDDPIGEGVLVRVWTLDGKYPRGEIEGAIRNLGHVAEVTRTSLERGFDVLATPRMGREVLPDQSITPRAAGLYFRDDGYCAIQTRLPPRFRPVALRHELMHALCHRALPDFAASRMVCEGLAEYLRLCRPGDQGLAVPAGRLADNLALLQSWIDSLSDRGVSLSSLNPARLVALPAKEFYALQTLGYLLSQAALAYLGPRPIEEAFAARTVQPIIGAIRRIDWGEFLEFVRANAAGGSAARATVMEDAGPEDAFPARNRQEAANHFRAALQSLAVRIDAGSELDPWSVTFPEERLFDGGLALHVLKEIFAAAAESRGDDRKAPLILADLSPAVESPFRAHPDSPLLAEVFKRGGEHWARGIDFLQGFRAALRSGLLAQMAGSPREVGTPHVDRARPFTAGTVPRWLFAQNREALDLVIFVAATDEAARQPVSSRLAGSRFTEEDLRAGLVEDYRRAFAAMNLPIRNALIIDLSNGRGDAFPLARALAAAQGLQSAVAYWDPQAPVAPQATSADQEEE